ncbi:transketolase-like TK C-terminal-containing protein [Acidisphaera sp. L21]|uniref:transketolase-like TK C-terminal-containing protein n=1 Tax=Acidisphaera sp. L21 TaxID=1641851 RepID=UPI00131AB4AC|nr:transketolase C-terminal domain-containing protein [Acidisphaera sp. L21]
MTWLADPVTLIPTPNASLAETTERSMADALRTVALSMAHKAQGNDAGLAEVGLAVGMADAATVLWSGFHRFDSADPHWPDRDRFVLSPGYGAPLLYALLHLTEHDGMDAATLTTHREIDSSAAGHPDFKLHPAIEATTGPLGQGLGMAVGMALAERLLAARFGKSLVDHRTWVIATLGDLMEGVSHEAASLAGHLRLEKLVVLLEDDTGCEDYSSALAGPDDALRRFAALGWATRTLDAHDPVALASALSLSARSRKPTLIACRTALGRGWIGRPVDPGAAKRWADVGHGGTSARRAWLKRLTHHPQRAEFERVMAGRLPEGWADSLAAFKASLPSDRRPASTRDSAERLLETLAPSFPELVGGQTELGPASGLPVRPGSFSGRQVHYGPREHGMAACLNGLALHGGLLPYAIAPLAATDSMRPALRLSAMMGLRAIHVATHDSIGLGAAGAAYQPVEQLAGLRAIPNLLVLRPADSIEAAECCELAVRRTEGPTMLVLSEQPLPTIRFDAGENRSARGAYVLAEANGPRAATLVATGSEVALALAARERLGAEGIAVAVVSMPAWGLFARAEPATRAAVLGSAPRFGIEAACGFGWERWLGEDGVFLGLSSFGASGPAEALFRHFNLTPESVAIAVKRRLTRP